MKINWKQYNRKLVERGKINIWISEDVVEWWYSSNRSGKGRPEVYSDKAIEMSLTLAYLYKLPLRMTEGFINSVFALGKIPLQSASYTQLCRRAAGLKVPKPCVKRGEVLNIAFDSTGLKVYGEGEWKVRIHGASKRRTWRKLHVALDTDTQLVRDVLLTSNGVHDASVACAMLAKTFDGAVKQVRGDGAYDTSKFYQQARKAGANPIVPPARNARQQSKIIYPAKLVRDNAIARIRMLGNHEEARAQWKKEAKYHKRSLVETFMYRFKNTFSPLLKHRLFDRQETEVTIKTNILNHFAQSAFQLSL